MHKKNMNPNLIHCCVCGHTICAKCPPGKTVEDMPIKCEECGAQMTVTVDSTGRRTVKELAGPRIQQRKLEYQTT